MHFDIQLTNTIKSSPTLAQLTDSTSFSEATSDSTYEFKKLYRDYSGNPIVLFDVNFKRQTMQVGQTTILNMLLGILGLGAILLIVTNIAVRKVALSRLVKLSSGIHDISEAKNPTLRIDSDSKKDEISYLQNEINSMLNNIEAQNKSIEAKSKSMASMLSNIEQGLIVLLPDGTIDAEYAAHTCIILHENDLAGKHWKEALFYQCTIDNDRKSQMEAVLFGALGEDSINWELNQDSVLRELTFERDSQKQYLELEYTALLDSNDAVEKMLISIRDVTQVRELVAQAELKQEELGLIEKLLELSPKDMERFISESFKRLQKAMILVEQSTLNSGEINDLFRELHTLKGNSRTCGFRELSSAVHNAEEPVQQMRSVGFELDLLLETKSNLLSVYEKVKALDAIYKERFKKILTSSTSSGMLLLPKNEVQRLLETYQDVNLHQKENVESFLKDVQNTLDKQAINTDKDWASIQNSKDTLTEFAMNI